MTDTKLLPCPFCGSKPYSQKIPFQPTTKYFRCGNEAPDRSIIVGTGCGAIISFVGEQGNVPAEKFNTRTPVRWHPASEPPSNGREVVITNGAYAHVGVFMDNEWLWCEPSENIAFGTVYRFLPCPVPPTHWCELSDLNLPNGGE